MSNESNSLYIPPFANVRLIECRDHIQLVPVPAVRVFYGYGRVQARMAAIENSNGSTEAIWDDLEPDEEGWFAAQWYRFEDGHEEPGTIHYFHPTSSEDEVRNQMRRMERFYNSSREKMLSLARCFEATDDDYDFVDSMYPNYQSLPTDPKATDEYDLYHARLKVLGGLHPKTVELIKIANGIKDPVTRQKVERQAVQSYFAELAHYWTEKEILAWQRSNPLGTGWMCEFGSVMHEPRRTIDPVNHELALNWLRSNYNLMTAEALSESIFNRIFKWLTPDAIKKRRERLGLTTKRKPGSPEK